MLASWAASNRPCMDGSAYTGIKFKVTGDVSLLLFRIATPATYPLAEGGTCAMPACGYAHYEKDVTSALTSGGMVMVPFADMKVPSWGMADPFVKSNLIGLVFLTTAVNTAHSFTIDDISFY
jgi:hypothetical protein